MAQVTAVLISFTAAAIKGSEPVEVSYMVPTSVLGPAAGDIDGEPTSPMIDVALATVNAVPASTPKLAALPRGKGPGPSQLARGSAAVTVNMAVAVLPPKSAVMTDVPGATPVAEPVCNPTVATPRVPEPQALRAFAVTSMGGPKLYVAIAVNG